jgi:hypothetical protein
MPRFVPLVRVARAALAPAAALALFLAGACGGGDDDDNVVANGPAPQIAFEAGPEGLQIGFGRVEPIVVRVTPPAEGVAVHFAMLGEVADAALNAGRAVTDAAGRAYVEAGAQAEVGTRNVELHASSRDTSFVIEARLDGGERAELRVVVSSSKEPAGSIVARPAYTGKRPVDHWVVQARPNALCSELGGLSEPTPESGWAEGLTVEGPKGEELTINNLAPGEPIALLAWGGPYARGCADVTAGVTTAKALNVDVPAQNVALDVSGLDVDVSFGLDAASVPAVEAMIDDWTVAFLSPFQSNVPADTEGVRGAAALLEAMRQDITSTGEANAAAFLANAEAQGWQAELATLAGGMPNATVRAWLEGAVDKMRADGALREPFRGDISSAGGGAFTIAAYRLLSLPFGSIAGAKMTGFGLVVDSNADRIAVTGNANFNHGALLERAIVRHLGQGSSGFKAALLAAVACEGPGGVAAAITNDDADAAYPGCKAACVADHCKNALTAMGEAALTTAAGGVAFSFTISGAASFDLETLALEAWQEGTWAGQFLDSSSEPKAAPVGTARATPR